MVPLLLLEGLVDDVPHLSGLVGRQCSTVGHEGYDPVPAFVLVVGLAVLDGWGEWTQPLEPLLGLVLWRLWQLRWLRLRLKLKLWLRLMSLALTALSR